MFEAKMTEALVLKKIIEAIKDLVTEAVYEHKHGQQTIIENKYI